MTFLPEARRRNIHWIKSNTEKKNRQSETAALDNWASEGGSAGNTLKVTILSVKRRKRFICYSQRLVQHDNAHYGHQ
jgi:hypothetical protein